MQCRSVLGSSASAPPGGEFGNHVKAVVQNLMGQCGDKGDRVARALRIIADQRLFRAALPSAANLARRGIVVAKLGRQAFQRLDLDSGIRNKQKPFQVVHQSAYTTTEFPLGAVMNARVGSTSSVTARKMCCLMAQAKLSVSQS